MMLRGEFSSLSNESAKINLKKKDLSAILVLLLSRYANSLINMLMGNKDLCRKIHKGMSGTPVFL